jgi:hypothetical protein
VILSDCECSISAPSAGTDLSSPSCLLQPIIVEAPSGEDLV